MSEAKGAGSAEDPAHEVLLSLSFNRRTPRVGLCLFFLRPSLWAVSRTESLIFIYIISGTVVKGTPKASSLFHITSGTLTEGILKTLRN